MSVMKRLSILCGMLLATSALAQDNVLNLYSSRHYQTDQALYDNPFVRPELLEEAFTPGFEDYGFGWRIDEYRGHRRMHHEGSTVGFRNFMQRFPEEHLTVIVLSNRREPGVESLAERVADLYLP